MSPIVRKLAVSWPLDITREGLATLIVGAEDALYDYAIAAGIAIDPVVVVEKLRSALGSFERFPLERPDDPDLPADYPTVFYVITVIRDRVCEEISDDDLRLAFKRAFAQCYKAAKGATVRELPDLDGFVGARQLKGLTDQCASGLFGRCVNVVQSSLGIEGEVASSMLGKVGLVKKAKAEFAKAIRSVLADVHQRLLAIGQPADESPE
jgi:hypothetical protein